MGHVILNIFGFSIINGMNSAFENIGNEYVTRGHSELCGTLLNRATVIYLMTYTFVIMIVCQTEEILLFL